MIGTKLGPYEIVAKLGEGGMGEVYKARDTRLDRTVAVKTLPPGVATAPEFRDRFEREARAISQLSHAHICTLFDVGEQGGTSFLVMEHLDGETLADRLAKGPVPVAQAITWAMQIAAALNAAHRQGILHRDLKPANIMVTPSGIKLLDFGLAKIVAGAVDGAGAFSVTAPPTRTPLTAQGTILGTFQYMAPEAVEGEEADERADIWAFGCVLYEMLTGQRAFAGKSQASLFGAILKEDAPSVAATSPLVPPALDRIVRTCLAKDPNQRVQSAHDLLLNLQWVAEGGSATGTPAPVIARRTSRDRARWAAVAVAVGAIGAAAAWVAKPAPAQPGIVTRFVHTLDPTVRFSRTGRHNVAMSPDGTFFVYVANDQLFIRRMNDIDAQPIKGSEEDPIDPVVSPDGQWVAYFVPATGTTTQTPRAGDRPPLSPATLKKIPVTGGTSTVLASLGFPSGVSWHDDVIVIGQGPGGVVSVPAGGGTPSPLVTLQPDEASAASPQLIDGGRTLLFSLLTNAAQTWNQADIVVQPVAGGDRTVVVSGGFDGRVLPTGQLVYARDNTVFGARFDERSGQRTGDPVPLIVGITTAGTTQTAAGAGQFSVGNGRIGYRPAAASGIVEPRTLVWVDRQGREQAIAADPRAYTYPRISPSGNRIALDALDTRRDIWILDLERDILTRLTQEANATDKRGPIWSPDGRSLFYSSTDGTRTTLLRRAADGTGTSEALVEEPSTQMVPSSVSPDGQTVIYLLQRAGSGYDVKALPLSGERTATPLLATPRGELNAELSPDGRWLAYQSDESGRYEIYVRPFPLVDAGRWQISNTGGTRPAWARNGRELFYLSADARMMAVPVPRDTGEAFTYGRPGALFSTSTLYVGVNGRTYDVAADGRFLLIKQPAGAAAPDNQAIVVVEHWIDEVRQRLGQ